MQGEKGRSEKDSRCGIGINYAFGKAKDFHLFILEFCVSTKIGGDRWPNIVKEFKEGSFIIA